MSAKALIAEILTQIEAHPVVAGLIGSLIVLLLGIWINAARGKGRLRPDEKKLLRWIYDDPNTFIAEFDPTFADARHIQIGTHAFYGWNKEKLGDEPAENKERRTHWLTVFGRLQSLYFVRKGDGFTLSARGFEVAKKQTAPGPLPVGEYERHQRRAKAEEDQREKKESKPKPVYHNLDAKERSLLWRIHEDGQGYCTIVQDPFLNTWEAEAKPIKKVFIRQEQLGAAQDNLHEYGDLVDSIRSKGYLEVQSSPADIFMDFADQVSQTRLILSPKGQRMIQLIKESNGSNNAV